MSNETKQTAVDSLEKAFYKYAESTGINNNKWLIDEEDLDKLIKQAKEMEKEQIENAYNESFRLRDKPYSTAKKYYEQTYGGNK
jgi:hypothetical protein